MDEPDEPQSTTKAPDSDASIPDTVRSLVLRPHETLAVELKNWLDPKSADGEAKIAKACLALRNQNGGYLVIGFDNFTKLPSTDGRPTNVAVTYHGDVIQSIVSRYSSHAFEVHTFYPQRDGHRFPVIQVPTGVSTPAMCKADLRVNGSFLLRDGEIYVRTLHANGTVSSARASWRDLDEMMRRCQDNREADLAAVLGRMVQGMKKESIVAVLRAFRELGEVASIVEMTPQKVIESGAARFKEVVAERQAQLPPYGAWEIGLVISIEPTRHRPNRDFLRLLGAANPDLTGWPVWVDSSDFHEKLSHPYFTGGHWEAFILDPPDDPSQPLSWGHLDFWIWNPKGEFYLHRALQDDFRSRTQGQPLTTLEPRLVTFRVAEALAVGQAFARAMQPENSDATLSFAFRWTRLRDRKLVPWGQPGALPIRAAAARDDEAGSSVVLPVSANEEAIARATHEAVLPVMAVFGGYEPAYGTTKSLVERVLQRRL